MATIVASVPSTLKTLNPRLTTAPSSVALAAEAAEQCREARLVDEVVEVVRHDAAAHRERDEEHQRQDEHREPGTVLQQVREVLPDRGLLSGGGRIRSFVVANVMKKSTTASAEKMPIVYW